MASYIKTLKNIIKFTGEKDNSKIKRINNIKEQLVNGGYQPDEVNYFVKSFADYAEDINDLEDEQLDNLIERLEAQLALAKKCRDQFS